MTEKEIDYYSEMYNEWFAKVEANMKYQNFDDIRKTFLCGGYYRYV